MNMIPICSSYFTHASIILKVLCEQVFEVRDFRVTSSKMSKDICFRTVPSRVASVTVAKRSVDSLTLEWQNVRRDWSYSLHINGEDVTPDTSKETVSEVIPSLQPGTEYPFRVTTIFAGLNSAAFESSTVTSTCKTAVIR